MQRLSSDYPRKPIALVVIFAAGVGMDVVARVVAKRLSEELGQPVNIVNKPGGNSIPGAMSVSNAGWLHTALRFTSYQLVTCTHQRSAYKVDERSNGWKEPKSRRSGC